MGALSGVKNVVGFLTILPIGMDPNYLSEAAKHLYLFPLVGALLGFLGGGLGWLGLHVFPPLVVGMLALGIIILLSGFHHIDGLLDFGDGVMAVGSPKRKIRVMHDQKVGTGGVALTLTVLLTTSFCIAELGLLYIIPALIIAETSAKFSMIVAAMAGKSAHKGMNTYFVNAMHDTHGHYRFLIALIASLTLALVFLRFMGPIVVAVGIIAGLGMAVIAHRHFNGVTGDVFGATNEITRMICIIAILAMIRWV